MGFFNLSKAFNEVSDAFGAKDTAIASVKLIGKTVVNLAEFAVTTGVDTVIKNASEKTLKRDDATEEQRALARKAGEWANSRIAARNKKENPEDEWE